MIDMKYKYFFPHDLSPSERLLTVCYACLFRKCLVGGKTRTHPVIVILHYNASVSSSVGKYFGNIFGNNEQGHRHRRKRMGLGFGFLDHTD